MSEPPVPVVAAFDVDKTLTTRDSVVPFLLSLRPRPVRRALGSLDAMIAAAARRDRNRIKAVVTEVVFAGRSLDEVQPVADRHGDIIHDRWLRRDTNDRLRWHLDSGHRVVLVSASYELYLDRLGERLGVDAVIGTRLVKHDGILTGSLDGGNCRGATKRVRLHRWLDEHAGGRAGVELWAYGDSAGDSEMLADADRAHLVSGPISRIP
jgi:phosphatidylglycerophosphatase C